MSTYSKKLVSALREFASRLEVEHHMSDAGLVLSAALFIEGAMVPQTAEAAMDTNTPFVPFDTEARD